MQCFTYYKVTTRFFLVFVQALCWFCAVFVVLFVFFDTMEHFRGLTLDVIGARSMNNQLLLVEHLMEAGLLLATPPECHGKMSLKPGDPWRWRCLNRDCQKTISVVDPQCFLYGRRCFYKVFKCAYLWCNEHPSKVIQKEAGLDKKTVASLLADWRSLLSQGIKVDNLP